MIIILLAVFVIVYLVYEFAGLYILDEEYIKVKDEDLLEALGEEITYNSPRKIYYPLSEQFDIILTSGKYVTVYKRSSFLFPYTISSDIGAVPVWWKSYKKIKEFHNKILELNTTGKTSSRHKLGL